MSEIRKLIEICSGHKTYIQTHNFPDPDAIATAYGLQQLFLHFGVSAQIVFEGRVDKISTLKMFDILGVKYSTYEDCVDEMTEDDYIVCVDSQKLGGNITDMKGDEIAAIDHHPTYNEVEYRYKDVRDTGACATIITQYYQELNITPDERTATALVYGIRMDTNQFSRGVTIDDIKAYEYLFPYLNADTLTEMENNNMKYDDLMAYGAAIENIDIFGCVGFSSLPFDCPDGMIAILSDFMLSLVEVQLAVLYSKRKNGWKFSIRCEIPGVDAGEIIHNAFNGIGNGGGHAQMAGGFVPIEEIEKMGAYPDDVIRDRILEFVDDKYEK